MPVSQAAGSEQSSLSDQQRKDRQRVNRCLWIPGARHALLAEGELEGLLHGFYQDWIEDMLTVGEL